MSGNKSEALLLYGKNIFISGACYGAAQYIAMALASEGANLVLADKNKRTLQELAANINHSYGLQAMTLPIDLSYDRDEPYQRMARSLRDMRGLDGIIILNSYKDNGQENEETIMNYPTPLWKDIMQINLDSIFILIKTLMPFLLSSSHPHLMLSVMDYEHIASSKNLAYGVSHYGLHGLLKLIAKELDNSHVSVSGLDLGADFPDIPQVKAKKIATAIPKLIDIKNKKFHKEIIDLSAL